MVWLTALKTYVRYFMVLEQFKLKDMSPISAQNVFVYWERGERKKLVLRSNKEIAIFPWDFWN